jgi:hypothetical protein
MRSTSAFAAFAMLALLTTGLAAGQGFKFSQQDDSERLEDEARQNRIA